MRKLTAVFCLAVALLMGGTGISWAADLLTGFKAYESGDYATALREWEPLAEQGHAGAQSLLGLMYRKGQGVAQDDKAAVKWYRLAAKQGFAGAQYNLGLMYAHGEGVPQDYKAAVKLFRLAAEQGDAQAQYNLGVMYDEGKGVTQGLQGCRAVVQARGGTGTCRSPGQSGGHVRQRPGRASGLCADAHVVQYRCR